jgi:peptidyl-prolyl cis-trans isomerase A (cyclophilin A)
MRLVGALALVLASVTAHAQTSPSSVPAVTAPTPPKYATVRVILTTSLGPITLELEKQRAPITTANFLRYVDQKRFDGMFFYRRSRPEGYPDIGFIQGGTANDAKRTLPPIAHESTTKTGLTHDAGTITMARLAPGTARGDFVIALSALHYLDANPAAPGDNLGDAAFGHVIDGMEIVRQIHAAPTSPTAGLGVMKGEMLQPKIRIITARRVRA